MAEYARTFLKNIEERFRSANKLLTRTLIVILTIIKYDRTKRMQEHIFEITNISTRLQILKMKIDESFINLFILNPLSPQYDLFQMNYNFIKDKLNENELASIVVQEEGRLKQQDIIL